MNPNAGTAPGSASFAVVIRALALEQGAPDKPTEAFITLYESRPEGSVTPRTPGEWAWLLRAFVARPWTAKEWNR